MSQKTREHRLTSGMRSTSSVSVLRIIGAEPNAGVAEDKLVAEFVTWAVYKMVKNRLKSDQFLTPPIFWMGSRNSLFQVIVTKVSIYVG